MSSIFPLMSQISSSEIYGLLNDTLDRISIDHQRTIKDTSHGNLQNINPWFKFLQDFISKWKNLVHLLTRGILDNCIVLQGELIVMLHAFCENMTFVPKTNLYVIPYKFTVPILQMLLTKYMVLKLHEVMSLRIFMFRTSS